MTRHRYRRPNAKKCKATGKIAYKSWVDAEIKRGNSESWHGTATRVYKCEFCHSFHLTTQPLDKKG